MKRIVASMTRFISHVHYLRGLAILFVVGVHARGGVLDWNSHPETLSIVATILDAEEGNGTMMFVFIGGFLFQYLNRNSFDYKKYLNTKFRYIILPYLIFSIPIIFFRIHSNYYQPGLPDDFMSYNVLFQFLYYLFVGSHMAPFWFISAIILYYLASPLFHYIDKPFFYKYIFPVVFIVGLFTYRPDHNANPFLAFVHFIPVYLTGMCISRYHEQFFSVAPRYLLILIPAYLGICYMEVNNLLQADITFEQVLFDGVLVFNLYYLRAISLCVICVTIFYIFRNRRFLVFDVLGHYSFGIFFIHFIVILLCRNLLSLMHIHVDFSLITFLLYFTLVVTLSTLGVYAVKRIAGSYSRNLIGS
jgi:probable poly-beta-1,6-N-acetyl-D-glucosamine export protein